ncbi:Purine permease 3 [Vitis vinifera]|uniref:Purine permease 3 n=1 Tax=Vitis vinifera TaxID=29760 RepID=A0A438ETM0_VITVI|nr:Purine permease 3 [Vitis vinifera]
MEAQMNLLDMQPQLTSNVIKKTLLVLNGLILSIGTCGAYTNRQNNQGSHAKLFLMKPPLLIASNLVGILTGLEDYLYAYGVAKLPVSTSTLIQGIELAFTPGFTFLLILAVIFCEEKFQVEKGAAVAVSLWGFVSYFYGEKRRMGEDEENLIEK